MNSKKVFLILLIASGFTSPGQAASSGGRPSGPPPGGKPPEPPASAYTACSGKSQGDSASDGNIIGICETTASGALALRPSGPPPGGIPPQ